MANGTSWRFCPKCGETKPAREFYRNQNRKSRRVHNCRKCENAASRRRYQSRLDFIREYKLERGCADCGYKGHPAALEFDHLPQFEKKYTISQITARMAIPHEVVLEEIAKCEVVCANCHRVRTYARGEHGAFHDLRREYREFDAPTEPPPFEQLTLEV